MKIQPSEPHKTTHTYLNHPRMLTLAFFIRLLQSENKANVDDGFEVVVEKLFISLFGQRPQ